jgi:hypothetical protein
MFDFDAFYSLETVEQKLKYIDETITPIVFDAITEFKNKYNLPGNLHKDLYFDKESGYEVTYELAHKGACVIRVMLYSDVEADPEMQAYYSIDLYLGWHKDAVTEGLSKEHILETLEKLKQATDKDGWKRILD